MEAPAPAMRLRNRRGVTSARPALLLVALSVVACERPREAPAPGREGGPPAVGVLEVQPEAVTDEYEFIGRVRAIERVDLVARVEAFLEQRLFAEGAEVTSAQLLYRLERGPFEAALAVNEAALAQAQAELQNARADLGRAQELAAQGAATRARLDATFEVERAAAARVLAAGAQVRMAQINLGYTEIRAPISGRIGRTAVTEGNVVGPRAGVLATIVSQDPMHVVFTVPMATALELRQRYAPRGGFAAIELRLRLPDGRMYGQVGRLTFLDIEVGGETDSIAFRGVIPNPPLAEQGLGVRRPRELTEGELVTVVLEAVEPMQLLRVPREAVLTDQQGDHVYVVGPGDRVERRPVRLARSTPVSAYVAEGLRRGERVVVEGVQRLQPGIRVAPAPYSGPLPPRAGARS